VAIDYSPLNFEEALYAQPGYYPENDGILTVFNKLLSSSVIVWTDREGDSREISPPGGMQLSPYWYGTQIGRYIILTNGIDVPHTFDLSDQLTATLVPMDGWPVEYTCRVIEVYKNFLFASGITENGEEFPLRVKWSDPFIDGSSPLFEWAINDQTLAGERDIEAPARQVRALQPLRDSLMIYLDAQTWRCDFVGGQFLFNFGKVFTDDGIASAEGWTNVKGKAVVFGEHDIYLHDGFNKQSITDGRYTNWITANRENERPVWVEYFAQTNELFCLFHLKDTGEAEVMLIWNELRDAWTEYYSVDGERNGIFTQLLVGPNLEAVAVRYNDPEAQIRYGEAEKLRYADFIDPNEGFRLYAVSRANDALHNVLARTGDFTIPRRSVIERRELDLNELMGTVGNNVKSLLRMYPQMQISGGGRLLFTVGASQVLNGAIHWENPIPFDPSTDYAVDMRVSGRYLAYRITADPLDPPEFWTLSQIDFEMADGGRQ